MLRTLRLGVVIAAFALLATSVGAADVGGTSKFITDRIAVSGAVEHPLVLGVDDLKKFPSRVNEVTLGRRSAGNAGKVARLGGVLLRDIIEKAAVISRDHNDTKKMAIIAIASDGYKVVFSWSEIFNSPAGDGVIVYFEKDGAPLADDEGQIAMISTTDIRTGPRHVKWLQAIEVRKIAD